MSGKNKKPGPKKLSPYSEETEKNIIDTYKHLYEKHRRIYAAAEALKLPHGGKSYVSELLDCSRTTILRGIKELNNPESLEKDRVRKAGGGRKPAIDIIENIDIIFLEVIDDYIAGDPMNGNIRWTNLSQKQIAERMKRKGAHISVTVVKKLLKSMGSQSGRP